ncbi:hypothetical protein HanLR1_Chr16g0600551 [Helianthus annuus]|nr:hypothetical protein HanLR1_Chr16g0600551 [Helianthus annuus]
MNKGVVSIYNTLETYEFLTNCSFFESTNLILLVKILNNNPYYNATVSSLLVVAFLK